MLRSSFDLVYSGHALEIVMPLIEQLLFEELFGILERRRIAGSHFAKELDQRGFSILVFR